MKTKNMIPVIGIALFLNGCSFMPKYLRPKPPVPAVLPHGGAYAEKAPQDAGPAAALRWQDVFPDRNLQNVIELALMNNRDLRLAMLNVERSRALYGVQKAELFPSVTASAAGSKSRVPADLSSSGNVAYSEKYNVDLGITAWEIDLSGRIRSLKEQALQEYLGTEQARRGARISLISETARAYLALAADLEKMNVARATLELQQNVYGMMGQQYDKGVATEMDLRRAQIQVDAAKSDIARYTQTVAQDRNALDLLAGCTVPEEFLPSGLAGVSPLKDIAPGLSSEVLLRRPDIMAAEHQLKAAYAFVGAARAAFFPRISLTTTLGTASKDLSGLFDTGSNTWSFVPQASMPVFDARTHAAYRVSKATRDIALAQYEKSIQTAFREVADALATRGMADQQLTMQEAIAGSAQKIYELANERYTRGIDSYLSVLDAQRSLYAAQQDLTSLRLARLASQVRLYAALGGDGEAEEAGPAVVPPKHAKKWKLLFWKK